MNNDRIVLADPVVFQGRYHPKDDHAFVIMPFEQKWSNVVWQTVKNTMTDLRFKCIRSDEQHGQQIPEDIWKGICEAAIIIADVTGSNPNVYYELGIAHVLGRRVILLTQNINDLPFDIRTHRHISYKPPRKPQRYKPEMRELSKELKERVQWILDNEALPSGGQFANAYNALRKIKP
jgi:hypothetical protein